MKKLFIFLSASVIIAQAAAQNIPRPNIPAPKGFSVNSFTGNLLYQRTDVTLRGVGFPLYATFYYNAVQDTLDYGYGKGWSFYYHAFYKEAGDTLIIQKNDAKKDTFRLVNGSYRAPIGIFDTLYKTGTVVVLKTKENLEYVFADATHKKLTGMRNLNGNTVNVVYNAGKPERIRNASGRCLLLNWQGNHLSEISDSAFPSKKYTYLYDDNRLQMVTNPLGGKLLYGYNGNRLIRLVDENNNPLVIGYGSTGRVREIRSCNTEQLFSYIDTLKTTFSSINNAGGTAVTTYLFDDKGRIKEISTPDNKKNVFDYDALNNINQLTRQNGRSNRYQYDTRGNLLKATDARGFATEYSYHPVLNKPVTIKDKRGNTSSLQYDAGGNLVTINKPGNITEQFKYNINGQVATAINGRGDTTKYEYNPQGDLVKIQQPIGAQILEYGGGCCNLSKITDANSNSLRMTYDLMNRLKTVKDDQDNTTTYEYDAAGNLVKETGPNGFVKRYGYDASNRLTSVQLPIGTWRYEYDGAGNFIAMKDAKGNKYSYEYDLNNRLVKETDPLGNSTRYTYDADGNLVSKQEPKGNTVNYRYDDEDRLLERAYEGNTDRYSYDGNGNMLSASNSNLTYIFEYDALNRLTKKTIPDWNKSIGYTYDSAGNRRTMIWPDGGLNRYFYDANNRLTSLVNHANLTTGFIYDPGGRLVRQNNANGTYATYTYDAARRVDSILHRKSNGDTIAYSFYTFDQYGNRKTLRDQYGLHQFGYDSAHRLTQVQYGDGATESFAMDANGNRTQRVKNGTPTSYSYNNADQVQTAGSNIYSFDPNGNMTANTETGFNRQFKYDGLNRLVEVQVTPTKKWQMKYGPLGEKVEKADTGNIVTRMLFDGDNLLGELNVSNVLTTKYTCGLGIDQWLSLTQNNQEYFFQNDGLNSVVALTNLSGNIENRYQYDSYGNITNQLTAIVNNILYSGRLWEKDLNLLDNRARYYNSKIGRFDNRDNFRGYLNFPSSLNKFVYVENNPINFIDQNGETPILVIAGVSALIGATSGAVFDIGRQIISDDDKPFCWKSVAKAAAIGGVATSVFVVGATAAGFEGLATFGLGKLIQSLLPTAASNAGVQVGGSWLGNALISSAAFGTRTFGIAVTKKLIDLPISKGFKDFNDRLNCKDPEPDPPGSQDPNPPQPTGDGFDIRIVIPIRRSGDPNEIIGPAGYDTIKRWVAGNATLPYKILFENDPVFATAPAQKVAVYMPIHSKLNPNSLRLGDFGFGSFVFTVPPNTTAYTNRLDVRDSLGVYVDVTAGLDITNRRAFWVFESIDTATGLGNTLPVDLGFLPVNDSTKGNGEGFVTLTLKPLSSVQTRDTVSAQAAIIFDINETINTNTWLNTIDARPPLSRLDTLPPVVEPIINLRWQGQDDSLGVGLNNYELYVSKNSGPFTLLEANIDTTGYQFVGEPGATYGFITRGVDYVGNKEPLKTTADQAVTVRLPNSTICPGANISFSVPTYGLGYAYQWQVDSTGIGASYSNINNSTVYSGATGNILTLSAPPTRFYGSLYRCVITSGGAPIVTAPQTLKFSVTWKGLTSAAWENPANWSCGVIPDGFTDVIIPTGSNPLPVINSNAACRSLMLKPGTSLTVGSGFNLDIKGK